MLGPRRIATIMATAEVAKSIQKFVICVTSGYLPSLSLLALLKRFLRCSSIFQRRHCSHYFQGVGRFPAEQFQFLICFTKTVKNQLGFPQPENQCGAPIITASKTSVWRESECSETLSTTQIQLFLSVLQQIPS